MTSDIWKLENDLCRCCHSKGVFHNLAEPCKLSGEEQNYVDMLRDSLHVYISPVPGDLCVVTYKICDTCVWQLRAAVKFKKQVMESEERFKDMYNRNFIKVADFKIPPEVKMELPDYSDDEYKEDNLQIDFHEDVPVIDIKVEDTKKVKAKKPKPKPKPKSKPKKPVKKVVKPKKDKVTPKVETKTDVDDEAEDDPEAESEALADAEAEDEALAIAEAQAEAGVETENADKKGKPQVNDYVLEVDNLDKKYTCRACEISYRRLSDLRYHIIRAHLKQKFIKCRLCSETFMYHSQRKDHMYSVHSVKKPEKFLCENCHRQFKRKNTLAEHMIDVHIEKKCVHCEMSFPRKKYMFHMNEAHNTPMPTCGICGLRTLMESALIRHQRNVHLNEKNKRCTICRKRFHTESNLRDHMITHNQDRVFKCDVCSKSFARKECFKAHYRIHTGERPFCCAICSAAFVQRASLRFHVKSHHQDRRLDVLSRSETNVK